MLMGKQILKVSSDCLRMGLAILSLALSIGCASSDRIEIGGRVTRKDGSPLSGAKVTFRAPGTGRTATGITDLEGHYALGTSTPGEGISPDEYYVTVSENLGTENAPIPATVHEKYTRPGDSGLRFKVEPGGATTYDIVLDPLTQ
jgi:hypothetical protein